MSAIFAEPQAAPPVLQGQLLVTAAEIHLGDTDDGNKVLIIQPLGQALQIVVPMTPDGFKGLAQKMLGNRIVVAGASEMPPAPPGH